MADEPTTEPTWIAWFHGWFNSPETYPWVIRGLSTAHLGIFRGGFSLFPTDLEKRLHGWERIDYQWPVVILERFRPTRIPALLLDVDGRLGLCGIPGRSRAVRRALVQAGFELIEVSVRGWDTPHAVPYQLLGSAMERLPPSLVARDEWAIQISGWRRISPDAQGT